MNPGALKTVIWFVELGNGTHPIHRFFMISLPLFATRNTLFPVVLYQWLVARNLSGLLHPRQSVESYSRSILLCWAAWWWVGGVVQSSPHHPAQRRERRVKRKCSKAPAIPQLRQDQSSPP
jgi:hypothetical protein